MTTSPTTATSKPSVLSDTLLARCHERAPIYDRENRFFFEDFEELRTAGYLPVWACIVLSAGAVVVSVLGVGADPPSRVLVANLGAQQATTIDFEIDGFTGQKTANIMVDPENVVQESDEDNNTASFVKPGTPST